MRRNTSPYGDDRERRYVPRRRRREIPTWRYVALAGIVAVFVFGFAVAIRSQLESLVSTSTPTVGTGDRVGSGSDGVVSTNLEGRHDGVFGAADEPGDGGSGSTGGEGGGAQQDGDETAREGLGCPVGGRVTDYWGRAVPSAHVVLETVDGGVLHTLTDMAGRYGFDAVDGVESVSVLLENAISSEDGFAVRHGAEAISMTEAAVTGCEVNFDAWAEVGERQVGPEGVGDWASSVEIFQNMNRAVMVSSALGLDGSDLYPFDVQAWCPPGVEVCAGMNEGAFFTRNPGGGDEGRPLIAIVGGQSELTAKGVPDNREYHEFGHLVQSAITGSELPNSGRDFNHGGYFGNPTSTDSMVEGFGEFLSMMVSKHVDGDPYFEMYRIGAEYDLEMDRLPWELEGWWEEFTVAGLLLDFEDGAGDYAMRGQPVSGLSVLGVEQEEQAVGTLVSGKVVNDGRTVVNDARVTVEYLDASGAVVDAQVTRVVPSRIAPGHEGAFYAVPVQGLEYDSVVARTGGVARGDDDDVDVELRDIVDVMFEFERDGGGAGVATVHDLYLAMSDAVSRGAGSFTGVTQGQVDSIFISHGFFEDMNGDWAYDEGIDGEIGMSSHMADGEFVRRWDPDDFGQSKVTIDTGGLADEAVIQIAIPGAGGTNSYSFTSEVAEGGTIVLPAPPSGRSAEMSVVALGDGLEPAIAFRLDADEFHQRLATGTLEEVRVSAVQLADAQSLESRPVGSGTSRGLEGWIMLGSAVLLGSVALIVLLLLRRQGQRE